MTDKQPLRFLLVRHGQSEANVERTRDIPDESVQLTGTGFAQADACGAFLADYLARHPIAGGTALYLSSYMRTRQTAQRIFDHIDPVIDDLRVQESDFLIEQHHGYFDGYEDEEKRQRFPDMMARETLHFEEGSKQFAPMHGGELRVSVAHRGATIVDAMFREQRDHGTNTFIVVSHGITTRQVAKHLLKMPREVADKERNPDNCDVRLLQRYDVGLRKFSSFGDFGAIWQSGQAVAAHLTLHPKARDLLKAGGYRQPVLRSVQPALT